jgi:probable rRNA maturation factor
LGAPFKVEFHQSKAARKKLALTRALQSRMRLAGSLVQQAELPEFHINLTLITMDDPEILELNNSLLGHDWFTDIITVEIERDETLLEAEIYLGVEQAIQNAQTYRNSTSDELVRLIIHGLLHLAGYDDHTPAGKKRMRQRERFFITRSAGSANIGVLAEIGVARRLP